MEKKIIWKINFCKDALIKSYFCYGGGLTPVWAVQMVTEA